MQLVGLEENLWICIGSSRWRGCLVCSYPAGCEVLGHQQDAVSRLLENGPLLHPGQRNLQPQWGPTFFPITRFVSVGNLSVKEHDLIFGENDIASQGHLFWDAAPDSMVYILSPSGDASKKVTLFECQDLPCCFVLTFCQEAILLPGSVSEEWLEILSHIKVWQLTHWAQHASCECWIDSTLHPSTRWYVWYQRFKLCGDEEQCNSWSQLRLVHLTCVGWRWISY